MTIPNERSGALHGSEFDSATTEQTAELGPAEVFHAVMTQLRAEGTRVPRATYRVQLNRAFSFRDALGIVDYLHALGVSELYASPFFTARPESTHGYDIIDHNQLNPCIGDRAALDALSDRLAAHGMGLLLDTVPNHMGIGTAGNAWWMDVLENGPSSLYARFFDIDWAPLKTELRNKVLLPVLGDHYGSVLDRGELKVRFEDGGFFLQYYDNVLPLNPRSYPMILEPMLPKLIEYLGEEHDAVLELQSIITGLGHLPPRTETVRAKVVERHREKEILKRRLAALAAHTPEAAAVLEASVARINGTPGDPASFDALDALLEEQAYRLSFWRVAAEEINYRRFFDINDLAAIRVEDPAVFAATHRLLFELLADGRVTGLRIDHPDGLWDPARYFAELQRRYVLERCRAHLVAAHGDAGRAEFVRMERALRELVEQAQHPSPGADAARRPLYIVVEKILSRGERLPESWPVHGTSGYEFASAVGALFVDAQSEQAMTETYADFVGGRTNFAALVYEKKKLILQVSLASELNVLAAALNRVSERSRYSRDFTLGALTDALREVIAAFPVYRTYVNERTEQLDEHDRVAVEHAIRLARRRSTAVDASVYSFLRSVLMLEPIPGATPADRAKLREFVMKFQQLTGPVMAKALEDTAFYIYNRLTSLNEVGGEPERYGLSIAAFHRAALERQATWPGSLNTTSTHDTKRSEDVRARISVLSELVPEWRAALADWSEATAAYKTELDGALAPDANEEYLFFQAMLGTFPFEPPSGPALAEYTERLVAYMRKALKEAKVNTSWINPNAEYDAAIEAYVRAALAPGSELLARFGRLGPLVAYHGMWGSLSQALIKFTAPGVPDIYHGNETWDLSLVDPDNRRPVDFAARKAMLAGLRERRAGPDVAALARELVARAEDGRIKMFVTLVALECRARHPELFGAAGAYAPLLAEGPHAQHVVAFARRAGGREVVAVAPRFSARLAGGRREPPIGAVWKATVLPVSAGEYENLFTRERISAAPHGGDGAAALPLEVALADFPVALLERVGDAGGAR